MLIFWGSIALFQRAHVDLLSLNTAWHGVQERFYNYNEFYRNFVHLLCRIVSLIQVNSKSNPISVIAMSVMLSISITAFILTDSLFFDKTNLLRIWVPSRGSKEIVLFRERNSSIYYPYILILLPFSYCNLYDSGKIYAEKIILHLCQLLYQQRNLYPIFLLVIQRR